MSSQTEENFNNLTSREQRHRGEFGCFNGQVLACRADSSDFHMSRTVGILKVRDERHVIRNQFQFVSCHPGFYVIGMCLRQKTGWRQNEFQMKRAEVQSKQ